MIMAWVDVKPEVGVCLIIAMFEIWYRISTSLRLETLSVHMQHFLLELFVIKTSKCAHESRW